MSVTWEKTHLLNFHNNRRNLMHRDGLSTSIIGSNTSVRERAIFYSLPLEYSGYPLIRFPIYIASASSSIVALIARWLDSLWSRATDLLTLDLSDPPYVFWYTRFFFKRYVLFLQKRESEIFEKIYIILKYMACDLKCENNRGKICINLRK